MIPLSPAPNLIQQVHDSILAAVTDGSLAPGERIRQHELAEALGVSRQPVSHALHLLHRQGMVIESGRKGFAVAPLEGARIRQLYEVRGALDGLSARLAAARASVDRNGRAALVAALEQGDGIGAETPLADLISIDAAFHRALYRLSGNPEIERTADPQWLHVRRSMAAVLTNADYRDRVWSEHRSIVERVLAGDADGAEAAARTHALSAGATAEARLATRPEAA